MAQIQRQDRRPPTTKSLVLQCVVAYVIVLSFLVVVSFKLFYRVNTNSSNNSNNEHNAWHQLNQQQRQGSEEDMQNIRPELVIEHPEKYLISRKCQQPWSPTLSRSLVDHVSNCYPPRSLRPMLQPNCTSALQTWADIQRCLNGRRRPQKPPLDLKTVQIHVIGERNSGTKWVQTLLAKCFPRERLGVRCHRDFLRSKHFFQPPANGNFTSSFVLTVVRDPLEWVAAMREKPYHMPYHMQGFEPIEAMDSNNNNKPKKRSAVGKPIPLDWREFVSRPWKMPRRSHHDLRVIREGRQAEVYCKFGFPFDQVWPCRFDPEIDNNNQDGGIMIPESKLRGHEPVYELRRDSSTGGQPYFDHLLQLRTDKLINFVLEVPLLMDLAGFSVVRYEDLLRQGTRPLLEAVANMIGLSELPPGCNPLPPQPERLGKRYIPEGLPEWVDEHVDVMVEHLLGYR